MAVAGWFGKLAVLGDFASRRLDPGWVQACDRWLSAGMQAGERRLGAGWLGAYRSAPVSRFVWAPGVVDAQWWFGILMPSCDNVGRYFPLVVAQARALPPCDRFALDHLDWWWQHVGGAAVSTLAAGASLDAFEAALHDAPPWPGAGPSTAARELTAGTAPSQCRSYRVAAGASALELAQALAVESLLAQLDGQSLWWPVAADGAAGRVSVWRGLPDAAALAGLLLPLP